MILNAKMRIVTFLATVGFASAVALGAVVAEGERRGDAMKPKSERAHAFEQLDANGDGSLDRQEVPRGSHLDGRFDAVDLDGDGAVSKEEYREHLRAERAAGAGG